MLGKVCAEKGKKNRAAKGLQYEKNSCGFKPTLVTTTNLGRSLLFILWFCKECG